MRYSLLVVLVGIGCYVVFSMCSCRFVIGWLIGIVIVCVLLGL